MLFASGMAAATCVFQALAPGDHVVAPRLMYWALRDWLAAYRVTHVAMEATGVYWQPVWHILEDDFELTLCNARHVKNVALV